MILLALNELNIEFVEKYISKGFLKNFKLLLNNGYTITKSEKEYQLLEPWIQWTTVQTGLSFEEHKIFRLGDIVERNDIVQIFEELEKSGLSVGVISAFNAENRLKKPSFFIPDPWTQTKPDGGFIIKKLSNSISKFVNSNASGKISLQDFFWLLIGFLFKVRIKSWYKFLNIMFKFRKPGVKAAILDMILLEVFVKLQSQRKPDYSHLFFNGLAHVQHHYMFNSTAYDGKFSNPDWYCPKDWDPVLMMLKTYDQIIGDLLKTGETIIGITGLSQIPHDQQTFYWRPKNHKKLLIDMGINLNFSVIPRMSRDFLINFPSIDNAKKTQKILESYKDSINNLSVFNVDNRGKSLFVEMIFPENIDKNTCFKSDISNDLMNLTNKFAFVAIKNGKHCERGYVFSNKKIDLPNEIELKTLYNFIKKTALNEKNKK